MPYEELVRQGRIRLHPASRREIENLLDLAARDLRASQANLDIAPEWAYAMAYNAILQAGRALMFSLGFRPRESEGHGGAPRFLYSPEPSELWCYDHGRRVAMNADGARYPM